MQSTAQDIVEISKETYKSSSAQTALTGRIRGGRIAAPNRLFISLEYSMQLDMLISEGTLFSLVDQESQHCGWQKKLLQVINKSEKRKQRIQLKELSMVGKLFWSVVGLSANGV
jgi:hypothetical protein